MLLSAVPDEMNEARRDFEPLERERNANAV